MSKPLEFLQVGPFRYAVVFDREPLAIAGDALGSTLTPDQRIIIRPGLPADQLADTVLHEALHALCDVAQLFSSPRTEETVVSRLAPLLLDLLRRNPRLVTLLTHADRT